MIFSRIVYSSILAGILTGILLTCLQVASLNPIIFAAERYEIVIDATDDHADDGHVGHSHDHDAWAPAAGLERTAYSFLANVLAATGFAAILMALMCLFCLKRKRAISWFQGTLWGLAGYAALFLAPAIGLLPEIPGGVAAEIVHRQLWWVLTALSVSVGFGLLAFARKRLKPLGLLLLALPYVVGAPGIDGPMFPHPDPSSAEALVYLHQQFFVISAITNLVFWLILGLTCRIAFNRWLRKIPIDTDPASA
jgi:cobalt transporter subunit CbtA